ncbi:MAG: hypothetical protein JRD88_09300 [Deltaproteobacteria bacterium]|nr:hypothetical protein [Deltaproteobacteria bacterium]
MTFFIRDMQKNRTRTFFIGFLVVVFSFEYPAIAYDGPLGNTINQVLAAYGGKDRLLEVKTVSAHGRIDDSLRKLSGGYARTMQRPDKLRIDIMPEKGGEVRVLNGSKGLQGSGDHLKEANPLSLSSMNYQYGYLDLPMSLADGTAKANHNGFKELHGRPMEILSIHLADAPSLTVYIDFETHLIRRVETTFDMGAMGSSLLGTEYDHYKMVDGLLFPFTLHNYAGEKNISTIKISRLTVNQPLPKGTFPTAK